MLFYAQFGSVLLGLTLLGTNAAEACCCCCKNNAPAPSPAKPADGGKNVKTQQVTITVSGMSCAACAAKVEKALSSVPGVRQVQVDRKKDQAVVTVEAEKYDEKVLLIALEKAGYGGKVAK